MTTTLTFFDNLKPTLDSPRRRRRRCAPFTRRPSRSSSRSSTTSTTPSKPPRRARRHHRGRGPDRAAQADAEPLAGRAAAPAARRGVLRAARADRADARRIALPQVYMFTAMNRIRVRLLDVVRARLAGDPNRGRSHGPASDPRPRAGDHARDLSEDLMRPRTAAPSAWPRSGSSPRALATSCATRWAWWNRRSIWCASTSAPRRTLRAPSAKHLDHIGGEVRRANKTIHDLLELARNRPAPAPRRERARARGHRRRRGPPAVGGGRRGERSPARPGGRRRPRSDPVAGQPPHQRHPGDAEGEDHVSAESTAADGVRAAGGARRRSWDPAEPRARGSSRPSSPPGRKGAAWGWRSAAGSWRPTKGPSSSRPSRRRSLLLSFPPRRPTTSPALRRAG